MAEKIPMIIDAVHRAARAKMLEDLVGVASSQTKNADLLARVVVDLLLGRSSPEIEEAREYLKLDLLMSKVAECLPR